MGELNPFPGPQPYRADDRGRFFGRERATRALADAVLGHRFLTVYGPSGAGKSSLLQAAALPRMEDENDVRTVVVDAWPPEDVARAGPEQRLAVSVAEQLDLGVVPPSLDAALALAWRRSSRPLVVVLDQSEQLLVHHPAEVLRAFAATLATLEEQRGVGLHVVVTLREDYLGRWNTLLRPYPRLTQEGFRVSRLTVPEMIDAVARSVSIGAPPQHWPRYRIGELVEAMALPGEWRSDAAEVEAAYVQIVCRALWESGGITDHRVDPDQVLRGYLDGTLRSLGAHEAAARALLETQFVTAGGIRVPVARAAALEALGDQASGQRILDTLEHARVLRAQAYQGDRFYEVGHDWLAAALKEAAARRRRQEAGRRARWRRIAVMGGLVASVLVAVGMGVLWARAERAKDDALATRDRLQEALAAASEARSAAEDERGRAEDAKKRAEDAKDAGLWDWARAISAQSQAEAAEEAASAARRTAEGLLAKNVALLEATTRAKEDAQAQARKARDAARMAAARQLAADPRRAVPFLLEVEDRGAQPGWEAVAWQFLLRTPAVGVMRVEGSRCVVGEGRRTALACPDQPLRWVTGTRDPEARALAGDTRRWSAVAVAIDGRIAAAADNTVGLVGDDASFRVVRAGKARIWSIAFSRDGQRLAQGDADGEVWTWGPDGAVQRLGTHEGPVWALAAADGGVYSVGGDGVLSRWSWGSPEPVRWTSPDAPSALLFVTVDPLTTRLLVGGAGGGAWILDEAVGRVLAELPDHGAYVVDGGFLPGGAWTLDATGRLRLWDTGDATRNPPEVGSWAGVRSVALEPQTGVGHPRHLALGLDDGDVLLGRVDARSGRISVERVLTGHGAPVSSVWWTGPDRPWSRDEDGWIRAWDSAPRGPTEWVGWAPSGAARVQLGVDAARACDTAGGTVGAWVRTADGWHPAPAEGACSDAQVAAARSRSAEADTASSAPNRLDRDYVVDWDELGGVNLELLKGGGVRILDVNADGADLATALASYRLAADPADRRLWLPDVSVQPDEAGP